MATETLRPNSNGHYMDALVKMIPDTGESQWEDVDEAVADDDATYVWNSGKTTYREGYFALPNPDISGTINQVTLYLRCAGEETPSQASVKMGVYTHSNAYWSSELTLTSSYADYSQTWPTNPYTGSAWTWAEICSLEAGISIRGVNPDAFKRTKCTQMWVEVSYNPAKTSADSGTGTDASTRGFSSQDEGYSHEGFAAKIETPTREGGMKIWI